LRWLLLRPLLCHQRCLLLLALVYRRLQRWRVWLRLRLWLGLRLHAWLRCLYHWCWLLLIGIYWLLCWHSLLLQTPLRCS
jgi:hypothetical protein